MRAEELHPPLLVAHTASTYLCSILTLRILAGAALTASAAGACNGIGPPTVGRDRSDYGAAIGDSWKQQTLRNKLRYGDFPVFMEIAQVIAGYQLQTTVGAGVSAQN
jgi:hypothetical protein